MNGTVLMLDAISGFAIPIILYGLCGSVCAHHRGSSEMFEISVCSVSAYMGIVQLPLAASKTRTHAHTHTHTKGRSCRHTHPYMGNTHYIITRQGAIVTSTYTHTHTHLSLSPYTPLFVPSAKVRQE